MSNHTKKEGEKNEYWIIIMVLKNKKNKRIFIVNVKCTH